jgi:hypothetical protein
MIYNEHGQALLRPCHPPYSSSRRDFHKMSYSRFPKDRLGLLSLAQSTKEFLRLIGLPDSASPYLGFGDFDGVFLPRLREWPQLQCTPPEGIRSLIVIGTDVHENPICVVEDGEQVVIVDQQNYFECTLMNSSVLQLAATVNEYQLLVEEAIEDAGRGALDENRIPICLVEEFERHLAELDPPAVAPGSFWGDAIADHREGLRRFESRKKYSVRFVGTISDREEVPITMELKCVSVLADAPVLRGIADFLSKSAGEIDQWGEGFGHAHFRDYWREWYTAYPDIIVARAVAPSKNQE